MYLYFNSNFVPEDHDYQHYLGQEFVKAIEGVECFRSTSSAIHISLTMLVAGLILALHVSH